MQCNNLENIPPILRERRQWTCWRFEQRDGKRSKLPHQPNGSASKANDPSTWCSFDEAVAALEAGGFDGIGFYFSEHDPFVGIDLDSCLSESGEVAEWAQGFLELASYAEVSPSGRGIKIVGVGQSPFDRGRRIKLREPGACVELYDHRRYFTLTGQVFGAFREIREIEAERLQQLIDALPADSPRMDSTQTSSTFDSGPRQSNRITRCIAFLSKIPDAVSGERGSDRTYNAICTCVRFGLSIEETGVVMTWFNSEKCQPAWTQGDLVKKIPAAYERAIADGQFGIKLTEDRSHHSHTPDPSYDPSGILGNGKEEAATTSIAGLYLPVVAKSWRSRFESLNEPPRFPTGLPFEWGPGMLLLLGAGPGAGKSTLAMQCVTDALLRDEKLRAIAVNVEMPCEDVYARQLAVHSGVRYSHIRYSGDLTADERERLNAADSDLQNRIGDRLCYVTSSDFTSIQRAVEEHQANILVLDYLQRVRLSSNSRSDKRQVVDELLAQLREICLQGIGVLGISSLGRPQKKGTGYNEFDITSFKESGELEYGSDEAFILKRDPYVPGATPITLKAVKLRHRPIDEGDIRLIQDDSLRFTLVESDISAIVNGKPVEVAS